MALCDLVAVMPAPAVPFEVASSDGWACIEKRLGTTLPEDYKEYINLYGSGAIANFLWILNPFSSNENINFEFQMDRQSEVLKALESLGEKVPYKPFPCPGGILPFGITDNGDVIFWETLGNPNDWSIVINSSRAPDWDGFNMSMSRFLKALLTKEVTSEIFPKNFPGVTPNFRSGAQ